jgi:hypothetical protein
MKSFTDQEYLELLQKLVDQQYDDAIDDYDIDKMEWAPSEPEIKKKIEKLNHHGMIDLTHVKSNKLKEEVKKCSNLRVGNFKITLTHIRPDPIRGDVGYDLEIREERTKTPSGMPCRIDYRTDIIKDSRFKGRPWLKYFMNNGIGTNVPVETIVDIVRWMRAIKKLTAFL